MSEQVQSTCVNSLGKLTEMCLLGDNRGTFL